MNVILDTGPWVALIDRSESRHSECVQWIKNISGRLYSTEAVLTEVLYLLSFSTKAQLAAIDFVLNFIIELIPFDADSLRESRRLMKKYSDFPMDYADATVVCLASSAVIPNIATFDQKHFNAYRLPKNRHFEIFP